MENNLIKFDEENIRRTYFNDEWYYSIIDIIEVLTKSSIPKRYWSDLKSNLIKLEGFQLYENIVRLKLESSDEKKYLTDCANIKSIFRIIQSIPSKKVEPFKQWLAQLGQDRIDEIQNPEIGIQRNLEYYKKKGYDDSWIKKRELSITTRKKLTKCSTINDSWHLQNVSF